MKNLMEISKVAEATSMMVASWASNDEEQIKQASEKWSQAVFEQMVHEYEAMGNDRAELARRGYRTLTTEEKGFYEKFMKQLEAPQATFSDVLPALPVTIINDIYKNIANEHPLLDAVNFVNAGYSTKVLCSNRTIAAAAWGQIPAQIVQEITSAFKIIDLTQAKLSCYALLPQDLIRMGATFLDAYVRRILTDSIAVALEAAIVTGTGKDQPIGMDRKVDAQAVVSDGVYAQKTEVELTSLDPETLGAFIGDNIATSDNGVAKTNMNDLLFICPAVDYWKKVMPATTVMNAMGQYVGGVLPVPGKIVPSAALETGHAILGFASEYTVGLAAPKDGSIFVSDEAKFIEDMRTFKAITYANGRAFDNSSFVRAGISSLEPAYIRVKNIAVESA